MEKLAVYNIKKVFDNFTSVGVIALYLGVPSIIVFILIWGIKKAVKD